MALAIFDAGGAAPIFHLLSLAANLLADAASGRRPRSRRLRTGASEAEAGNMLLEFAGAELALMVINTALGVGREEAAIEREGIDPVARTVLDAGGHIAVAQFKKSWDEARKAPAAAAVRKDVDDPLRICEPLLTAVLQQLGSRPVVRAAMADPRGGGS